MQKEPVFLTMTGPNLGPGSTKEEWNGEEAQAGRCCQTVPVGLGVHRWSGTTGKLGHSANVSYQRGSMTRTGPSAASIASPACKHHSSLQRGAMIWTPCG